MAIASTSDLLGLLRQFGLLEPAQLDQLVGKLGGRKADPRTLGKNLIDQGWLTPYQVNQLLQGRGKDLVLARTWSWNGSAKGGNGQVYKACEKSRRPRWTSVARCCGAVPSGFGPPRHRLTESGSCFQPAGVS
jgi:hypothetical protein